MYYKIDPECHSQWMASSQSDLAWHSRAPYKNLGINVFLTLWSYGLSVKEPGYYLRDYWCEGRELVLGDWCIYMDTISMLCVSAKMWYALGPGTNQLRLHFSMVVNFSGLQFSRFIYHSCFMFTEHWLQLCYPSLHSRTPKLQTVHIWDTAVSWHRGRDIHNGF